MLGTDVIGEGAVREGAAGEIEEVAALSMGIGVSARGLS